MTADSPDSFTSFFAAATGGHTPFGYQRRLAEGKDGDGGCVSRLIDVPTGCGKTAAVVLAWLWNRVAHPDAAQRARWPRRLVYCLPMRTLVEQTRDSVRTWLLRLARQQTKPRDGSALRWLALHSPYILMGGEKSDDWDTHPERDAILIGTQDMLLSRALNRGYGLSRYRWPMPFGLLNNDCLWVMDETQLMGPGLATTAQLDAFRVALWGVERPCPSWWMSATVSGTVFNSTDRRALIHPAPAVFALKPDERAELTRAGRLGAEKRVTLLGAAPKVVVPRDGSGILDRHQPGRITLVIANTVPTALRMRQEMLAQLEARTVSPARGRKKAPALPLPAAPAPPVILLHGRFRRPDRQRLIGELTAFMDRQARHGGQVPVRRSRPEIRGRLYRH